MEECVLHDSRVEGIVMISSASLDAYYFVQSGTCLDKQTSK